MLFTTLYIILIEKHMKCKKKLFELFDKTAVGNLLH